MCLHFPGLIKTGECVSFGHIKTWLDAPWADFGEQVDEWAEAGDRNSKTRVSRVGHQTAPGSEEVQQQQSN